MTILFAHLCFIIFGVCEFSLEGWELIESYNAMHGKPVHIMIQRSINEKHVFYLASTVCYQMNIF